MNKSKRDELAKEYHATFGEGAFKSGYDAGYAEAKLDNDIIAMDVITGHEAVIKELHDENLKLKELLQNCANTLELYVLNKINSDQDKILLQEIKKML